MLLLSLQIYTDYDTVSADEVIVIMYLNTYQLITMLMVYIIFSINKSEKKILKSHWPVVLPFQKVTGQLFAGQLSTGQLSTHL